MPVKRLNDLTDTPHYKGSKSDGPPAKADHEHEYVRPYTMARIQRFDGSISDEKYPFELKPYCLECGKIRRRPSTIKDAMRIEISPAEYLKLKDSQK